jgi:hypothetical protein
MLRKLEISHIIWQDYCTIHNTSLRPCLWDNLMFASVVYRKAKLICRLMTSGQSFAVGKIKVRITPELRSDHTDVKKKPLFLDIF